MDSRKAPGADFKGMAAQRGSKRNMRRRRRRCTGTTRRSRARRTRRTRRRRNRSRSKRRRRRGRRRRGYIGSRAFTPSRSQPAARATRPSPGRGGGGGTPKWIILCTRMFIIVYLIHWIQICMYMCTACVRTHMHMYTCIACVIVTTIHIAT